MPTTKEELSQITIETLSEVHRDHTALGKEGLTTVGRNPLGEKSFKGDVRAEEIVIETFRRHNVSIKFLSEEHGEVELGDEFLAPLDGIDGTNRYIAFMNGDTIARYGTIVTIFQGTNPYYKDYLVSGLMEHPTKRLFIAIKGEGVFLVDVNTWKRTPVRVPPRKSFDTRTKILVDNYEKADHHQFLQTYIRKITQPFGNLNSTAAHYAAIVSDEADIVFECTRKGNLEHPCGYALMTERKGVTLTLDEEDLGTKRYLDFHRGKYDYTPLVHAANEDTAKGFIRMIRSAPTGI